LKLVARHEHELRDRIESQTTPIDRVLEPRHFERREPFVYGGGGKATCVQPWCLLANPKFRALLEGK
jgi:hypothetical protein